MEQSEDSLVRLLQNLADMDITFRALKVMHFIQKTAFSQLKDTSFSSDDSKQS